MVNSIVNSYDLAGIDDISGKRLVSIQKEVKHPENLKTKYTIKSLISSIEKILTTLNGEHNAKKTKAMMKSL